MRAAVCRAFGAPLEIEDLSLDPPAGGEVRVTVGASCKSWQTGLYGPRPEVVDGAVHVPDGPGWGVEISPEWLSRSRRWVSRLD